LTGVTLTAARRVCVLLESYLMIPELFDEEAKSGESTAANKLE